MEVTQVCGREVGGAGGGALGRASGVAGTQPLLVARRARLAAVHAHDGFQLVLR